MTDIKPIETVYNGYRFRSRLEARWAVFFDALGVKYEYGPGGFEVNGVKYLPDFLIYDVEGIHAFEWRKNIYVEVKGSPDYDSACKVSTFCGFPYCDTPGAPAYLPIWVVGNIPDPSNYIYDMEKQRIDRCSEISEKISCGKGCALCINDFGTLDGDTCFGFSIDFTDHLIFHGADSSYGYGEWSQPISNAFAKARQAHSFSHAVKQRDKKNKHRQ